MTQKRMQNVALSPTAWEHLEYLANLNTAESKHALCKAALEWALEHLHEDSRRLKPLWARRDKRLLAEKELKQAAKKLPKL